LTDPFSGDDRRQSLAQDESARSPTDEPTRSLYAAGYHLRHELPANPTLQTALAGLVRKEIVGRNGEGEHSVIEPFPAEWLQREGRSYGVGQRLRAGESGRAPERPAAAGPG
jgi:hypothetical protein